MSVAGCTSTCHIRTCGCPLISPRLLQKFPNPLLQLYKFFQITNSAILQNTGPILQEKVRKIAHELKVDNFKASQGWLDSFRNRHSSNIRHRLLSGAPLDDQVVENWKTNLVHYLSGYDIKDIWNNDDTGLLWRSLPHMSLVEMDYLAKGWKLAVGHSIDRNASYI